MQAVFDKLAAQARLVEFAEFALRAAAALREVRSAGRLCF